MKNKSNVSVLNIENGSLRLFSILKTEALFVFFFVLFNIFFSGSNNQNDGLEKYFFKDGQIWALF